MADNTDKMGGFQGLLAGILALQGAYQAHAAMLQSIGCPTAEIRKSTDIPSCSHLLIPGGETTTFLKLLDFEKLADAIIKHASSGKPIFGTCAGLILLASEVRSPEQRSLGLLDVVVERNSYGRQVDSFEADLTVKLLDQGPFPGVFIRAPRIISVGPDVEVLAVLDGDPVLVRQGNIYASTFHPELTCDSRIHRLFLSSQ